MRKELLGIACGLPLAIGLAAGCSTSDSSTTSARSSSESLSSAQLGQVPKGERAEVAKVYDGDTMKLADGRKVRFIGIDAPEEDPTRGPVQCFGIRSAEHLRASLPKGAEVILVHDVESKDQYGRTLAYVYRERDGMFMNAHLLREGFVQAYRVPPNVRHAEEFRRLQATARSSRVGLWGKCRPGDLTPRPGGAQPEGN